MQTPFIIDTAGNAAYHASRALSLEKLIYSKEFDSVEYKLTGLGGLHPSVALTYLDLIDHGPPKLSATILAFGHLLGAADMALWLGAARHRELRPNAIVWVPHFPVISDCRWCYAQPVDPGIRNFVLERDNEVCLKRIAEHCALDLLLDRMLGRADLTELLLLQTPEIDRALQRQEVAATPPKTSHFAPEQYEEFDAMFGPDDADGDGRDLP
jgi:hypothetical protein